MWKYNWNIENLEKFWCCMLATQNNNFTKYFIPKPQQIAVRRKSHRKNLQKRNKKLAKNRLVGRFNLRTARDEPGYYMTHNLITIQFPWISNRNPFEYIVLSNTPIMWRLLARSLCQFKQPNRSYDAAAHFIHYIKRAHTLSQIISVMNDLIIYVRPEFVYVRVLLPNMRHSRPVIRLFGWCVYFWSPNATRKVAVRNIESISHAECQ